MLINMDAYGNLELDADFNKSNEVVSKLNNNLEKFGDLEFERDIMDETFSLADIVKLTK